MALQYNSYYREYLCCLNISRPLQFIYTTLSLAHKEKHRIEIQGMENAEAKILKQIYRQYSSGKGNERKIGGNNCLPS